MRSYYFLKNGQSIQRISLEGDPPGIAEVLQIGLIEPNCKVNVSYNLHGDGGFVPSIFCHDQTTGNVFYYFDNRGRYEKFSLGNIPPEWQLQVFRIIDATGELGGTQIFGHNRRTDPKHEDYGKVQIWNIHDLSRPQIITRIGPEWELMLGDFDGNHFVDFMGRRMIKTDEGAKGDLRVWFMGASSLGLNIVGRRDSGNIGVEWKLQVADMNFDGRADLFGYNANSDLWAWYNINDEFGPGRFDGGKSYGTFKKQWQHLEITHLRSDVPASADILGIATNGGEVHSWPLTNGGLRDNGVSVGSAPTGWLPLGGLPLTRVE